MKLTLLALLTILILAPSAVYGQSDSRASQPTKAFSLIPQPNTETDGSNDLALATRAIAALKRLDNDAVVYRSLGEFEAGGKLARVPLDVFRNHLQEVSAEVEMILSRLPPSRLKIEIRNALDSYRDGAFWWQKIYQPRVVNVSALTSTEIDRTPADAAFLATVPYTVAIHWRQAGKYLKRAQELVKQLTRN